MWMASYATGNQAQGNKQTNNYADLAIWLITFFEIAKKIEKYACLPAMPKLSQEQ